MAPGPTGGILHPVPIQGSQLIGILNPKPIFHRAPCLTITLAIWMLRQTKLGL